MPSNFQWQAGDDEEWVNAVAPDSSPSGRIRIGRWLRVSALIGLAAIIGWWLTRTIGRQISDTTIALERDVIATHELVLQAADTQDGELFTSFLSGRSSEWSIDQIALVDQGLLFERPELGTLARNSGSFTSTVELSPDYQQAQVTTEMSYRSTIDDPTAPVIRLNHLQLYRQGGGRWLLSPPFQEFWGGIVETRGRFLSLTFRDREGEIGHRLAADLEALLGSACTGVTGLVCLEDRKLQVNLGTEPGALIDLSIFYFPLLGSRELVLPTPTLLGFPLDDVAYRALRRRYAEVVVTRMIVVNSGYQCCHRSLFARALIDTQLDLLEIKSWPMQPDDYGDLLNQAISLQHIGRLFQLDGTVEEVLGPLDRPAAYAFIDFLVNEQMIASSAEVLASLSRSISFDAWLAFVSEVEASPETLETAWRTFLESRASA